MKPLSTFRHRKIDVVFTDIDGTLTDHGRLPETSYSALWRLHRAGRVVVPITGRPAGWCDLIARQWPVHGVIGENGGLIYCYQKSRMRREYMVDKKTRASHRLKLKAIAQDVLAQVPGAKVAADQFSRLFDLAIDFAEDVPELSAAKVQQIKNIFEDHGAHAKISNIHVNGWFGNYDKLTTCALYCKKHLGFDLELNLDRCAFVGDSPNDEPMFKYFTHSFGVANIQDFAAQLTSQPAYISTQREGLGFAEIVDQILRHQ